MSSALALALFAFLASGALAGCGEKGEPEAETPAPAESEPAPGDGDETGNEGGAGGGANVGGGDKPGEKPDGSPGSGPAESGSADPRLTAAERAAARAVRAYVAAIDARDGARLCDLMAPGALEEIELPRERGGCAESLSTSIGYRDPRGLPVFEQARFAELRSLRIDGDEAKAVATVVTIFADRTEPSIEDDVIHLERAGERWTVAKPSATLYRAVGIADVPPTVLAPP
jgi:hypothetical protein